VTGGVVFRRAEVADAEAGGDFHRRVWQEAYADLVAAPALAAFTADERAWVERWQEQIAHGAPRFLALDGSEIVGFSVAGVDPGSGSEIPVLYAIYVSRRWQGTGIAQSLLDLSIGGGPATLWVFADNTRAVAFYARNRFVPDGSERIEEGFGICEIRMARPADPAA